jgi:imidazolonepropionase-like amidohydrolase
MWKAAVTRKPFISMTALLLALLPTGQLPAQSSAVATLVKAGRLLDPRSGNVLSPAAVLVENGRIKEVGSPPQVQADAPAGTKTIDLGRT